MSAPTHPAAPCRLQCLADNQGFPAALRLLTPSSGHGESWLKLAQRPDLAVLCACMPCLIDEAALALLPDQGFETLARQGVLPLPAAALREVDRPPLPPRTAEARWLTGEWFMQPASGMVGTTHSGARPVALQLLQLVDGEADNRDIEAVLRRDPALSYHLLRLVNSVGCSAGRQISSYTQALLILGRQQLRRWIHLLVFASQRDDPRMPMLLARAAVRAQLAELLARELGLEHSAQDQANIAGLFSLLGVLFGQPLADVLKPLRLAPALSDALLRHGGPLATVLTLVEQAESASDEAFTEALATAGIAAERFSLINLEAHQWMGQVVGDLERRPHD